MARSKETFGKKEREKKRLQKRKEKEEKKSERQPNTGGLDEMMVYLDENGNFTNTPPDVNAIRKEIDPEKINLGATKIEEVDLSGERFGKVDFFNHDKGFGFIIEAETSKKYFVHINNVNYPEIDAEDKVVFELEDNIKGINAVRVKKRTVENKKASKPAEIPLESAASTETTEESVD